MTATVQYAGLSDCGRVRTLNEDRWVGLPDLGLYIVADGIGGQPGGNVAGMVVVKALPALVGTRFAGVRDLAQMPNASECMCGLLCELSDALRREGIDAGVPGLGSTVVAVLIRGDATLVAHMGDSRAYLFRENCLRPLTRDHTVQALLVESGKIPYMPGGNNAVRSRLTRYVGMKSEPLPECHMQSLHPEDVMLLCTDGLTDMMDESAMEQFIRDGGSPEEICARLVAAANEAGGRDNICVVVLKIGRDDALSQESVGTLEGRAMNHGH